jgi:Fe-S oxidoreductase
MPKFTRTFRSQFRASGQGERVVLFDDTFNNHFRPQTAVAAQKVLERAGYGVQLPGKHVCCGRPYYDFGMLDRARRSLERVLEVLAPQLDAGLPIVVLEPGCLSVFKDEIRRVLPEETRLPKQAMSLAQALGGRAVPSIKAEVLVHGHCHQKALMGMKPDIAVLEQAGCRVSAPDTGCCGMGGSFGYRPEFYEASKRIAGLEILPALAAAPGAAIVADGFSCREQIEGLAGRPTLHLAELLAR